MFLNKDDLSEGSINFKYLGHIGPETKKKKAGGTYEVYTFQLNTPSNDVNYQYDINKQGAEYGDVGSRLIDCKRGDTIQAYINGDWVNWRVLPRQSEPSTMHSAASENMKNIKAERNLRNVELAERIRKRCMAQAGAGQAYITGVLAHTEFYWKEDPKNGVDTSKLISDAVEFGAQFAKANRERALKDITEEAS